MRVLTDEDLVPLVENVVQPLIQPMPSSHDWYSKDSLIQPSSIDLHVGELYSPGRKGDADGNPLPLGEKLVLEAGQTVVIRTLETICLPPQLFGFGFPPSRISKEGILMTNPGHLDPGYQGPLHLTAINMGSEPFELRRRDLIVTIVLFELHKPPKADFGQRYGTGSPSHITQEQLERLSADFVNVSERAGKIARKAVRKAQLQAALISTSITALLGLATLYWNSNHNIDLLNQSYANFEKRVDREFATNKEIEGVKRQAVQLKQQVDDLAKRVK